VKTKRIACFFGAVNERREVTHRAVPKTEVAWHGAEILGTAPIF